MKLWIIRTFGILSEEDAKAIGLKWHRNIYGDEINHINCRSIWVDNKNRPYRVNELTTKEL